MLRFCSLGSGSTGNATLVEGSSGTTTTRLLIDCGFSLKELENRLALRELALADIDALFITHEHADHVGCALALARRQPLRLCMSRGTWQAIASPDAAGIEFVRDGERVAVGDLELVPYTVPHDAREPLQLVCGDGAVRLGVLTDTGAPTPYLLRRLEGCEALVLECNHDPDLLAASSYPPALKARIAGAYGHLGNDAATRILAWLAHGGLRHVVAAHLSEMNNTKALAQAALGQALGASAAEVVVADPVSGFGWLTVD